MKRSYFIAGAFALAATGWVLSGEFGRDESIRPETQVATRDAAAAATQQPSAVAQVRVRRQVAQPHTAEIVLRGRTAADRIVEIRAETRGTVAEILAEKGARVGKDQILVRLSDEDRQARLREARAALQQRQIEYDAGSKLAERGFRSQTALAEVRARLEEARAAVAAIEVEMSHLTIRAPFAGLLQERPAELGAFVDVGDHVATIVDLDPIIVLGDVSERDVGQVRVGMPGTARLLEHAAVEGIVRYVSSVAEETTHTFRVELEAPNADYAIPEGVSAELTLPAGQVLAHKLSPAALSLDDQGRIGVKVLGPGNVVAFRPVTILDDEADGVWLGGLPETVTFITVGQEFVAPGQPVQPVPDESAPEQPSAAAAVDSGA